MADVTMGKITQINLGDRFIPCNIVLPLTTKMSANFTLAEMVDPTTNELILYPLLLTVIQEARTRSGCEIHTTNGLSWYRGYEYNKAIGGSPTSLHLAGGATDSKWYYGGYGGVQIHPIHCAYIMQEISKEYGLNCELGVYLPGYDGSATLGYLHYAITQGDNYWYYFDKKGIKHEVKSLTQIAL